MIDTPQITQTAAQGIAPAGPWFTHHLKMDPATWRTELNQPLVGRSEE